MDAQKLIVLSFSMVITKKINQLISKFIVISQHFQLDILKLYAKLQQDLESCEHIIITKKVVSKVL